MKDYESMKRPEWIARDPSQVVLLVNNIFWCNRIEDTFRALATDGKAMKTYIDIWNQGLKDLIIMV